MKNCPYCESKRVEEIVIRFVNGNEQRVNFCLDCKKIFNTEGKNRK